MKDAECWLVASSLVFRFIALGWNMRNYLSQPFYFLLIGSCPEQWGCLYPVFKSQGHGSMCALFLHYNTSLESCAEHSSQLSSPGAAQNVRFWLRLRSVRLSLQPITAVLSFTSWNVFWASFPKLLLFFVCLFWYFCFCFWITELYLVYAWMILIQSRH